MESSKTIYKNAIETTNCSICLYDRSGRMVFCNDYFKKMYLIGTSSQDELHYTQIPVRHYQKISFISNALLSTDPISEVKLDDIGEYYSVSTCPVTSPDGRELILESISRLDNQPSILDTNKGSTIDIQSAILSDVSMKPIMETIHRISQFDSTILISGESGTGKSVLAKFIHENSMRANGPFITIDCATIPENLIESELFGYVSGAFTGASQKGKQGMVELSNNGTLFLDEIGLLPLGLQTKFLQLIQERTYTPVGALKSKNVDTRIISATNMELKELVKDNKFREDLYYRLRVIEFKMPPLRARQDAIEPLILFFLGQINLKYHISKTISDEARELLKHHLWKGNIRELQYTMEKLVATSPTNQITISDIHFLTDESYDFFNYSTQGTMGFEHELEHFEYNLLRAAFDKHKSSYKVASALGLSQSKASRLLRKHRIK